MGRLRRRGRERARAGEGGRRLDLPAGGRGGRRGRARSACRFTDVIDLRAARADPAAFRAALARKGAAEAFDALLAADERWRALAADGRRAARPAEAQGQADAGAARGARAASRRSCARPRRSSPPPRPSATRCSTLVPNPPDPSAPDGDTDEDAEELRRVGDPAPRGPGAHRGRPLRDGARRARSRARASATSSATRRCSRSRSTASRSTAPPRTATCRCCRRCSCARRRCTAPASSRPSGRTSTRSRPTTST